MAIKGRIIGAAWFAAIGIATGANAQAVVEVPAPYLIPLPPVQETPAIELGARYWSSIGSTKFNINSSRINPSLGNPTSTLEYTDMRGNSAEFTYRARSLSGIFAKGFVGGGWLNGGSLDDEDFFARQIKFSDTYSKLDGESLGYGTIDLGQNFNLLASATRVSVGPFIGFNYWQETAAAYGVRCNPDQVGGAFCGPPGSIAVPFATEVIKNETHWASMRVGTELRATFWNRFTFIGDAAVLPFAYVWNNDSHLLRRDLGPVPNIEDRGTGWGYQLEATLRYDFNPCWSAGAGFRFWHAETDGKSEFVNLNVNTKLDDFESERYGVFADVAYRF